MGSTMIVPGEARTWPTLGLVDGRWVGGDDGRTFSVTDPATGTVIAEVPRMGAAETVRAIQAATGGLSAATSAASYCAGGPP
jgi:succinate-semialdehyde dehydrogenase / glutarate-semialdehyde dehydrogenase